MALPILPQFYSLFVFWHTFCKQVFLLLLLTGLLRLDQIFDQRASFESFCLRPRQNTLVLNKDEWFRRHAIAVEERGWGSWRNHYNMNKRSIPRLLSFSFLFGKSKNNKIYNNYQVCRTRHRTDFWDTQKPTGNTSKSSRLSFQNSRNSLELMAVPNEEKLCVEWGDRETKSGPHLVGNYILAAAQTLPDFTTEDGIFTGRTTPKPPTPRPLGELEASVVETYARFTTLKISWKSQFNVSMVRISYKNVDDAKHTIDLPVNLTSGVTANIYRPGAPRKGFTYILGGLTRRKRYFLEFRAYLTNNHNTKPLYTTLSYLTGDQDADDRFYDLKGIFMVLGISTIIMVVVLICVGYEKLLHEKKNNIIDFFCCRKKKKPKRRVPNGSISPEPLMVSVGRSQVVPMDPDSSSSSSRGYGRY